MWLIDTDILQLCYFNNEDEVDYAILSYRWEEEEVSLQDLRLGCALGKKGYAKIKHSCAIALHTGIQYMWIDTCCIDKNSSAELSEAINSMYRWYERAKICYAYLSEIESTSDLARSKWFTRGWTLQELIAPKIVKFYNKNWKSIGSRAGLQGRIASITGIPVRVLTGAKPSEFSVAQRMSWAANRVTTRPEDRAYCLMGLFEVNMPMLYGEGTRAFARLQEEIIKILDDQSIFAWTGGVSEYSPILAAAPANFQCCANVRSTSATSDPTPFSLTNVGLNIELPILPYAMNKYLAILQCQDMTADRELMPHARSDADTTRIGILIRRTSQPKQYVRCVSVQSNMYQVDTRQYSGSLRTVPLLLLQHLPKLGDLNDMYGFYFRTITDELFRYQCHPYSPFRVLHDAYHVVCKLPEDRINEVDSLFPGRITQKGGRIQKLTDVRGLDVELEFGERGIVAMFALESKAIQISTSRIVLLKVGFDFNFNPVSIFYDTSSDEWKSYCQSDGIHWTDDQDLDKELAVYADMDQSQCWETHGVCALRGSRTSGLDVDLTHLNIHLTVAEGYQNGRKKWIIDLSPWSLPFVYDRHRVLQMDVMWKLYCDEEMKLEQKTEVLRATEQHWRLGSSISKIELMNAEKVMEGIENEIVQGRLQLQYLQHDGVRGVREVIEAIEAVIMDTAKEMIELDAPGYRNRKMSNHPVRKMVEERVARVTMEVLSARLAREQANERSTTD